MFFIIIFFLCAEIRYFGNYENIHYLVINMKLNISQIKYNHFLIIFSEMKSYVADASFFKNKKKITTKTD